MTGINSFYRSPNATTYMTQLFSTAGSNASVSRGAQDGTGNRPPFAGGIETSNATERALARITEILFLRDNPDSAAPAVEATSGYITRAKGSEGDDRLTLTGQGAFNVDTGEGNDTVTVKSAAVIGLTTGNGNDTIRVSGQMVDGVDAGAGDDAIELAGRLLMAVSGGDGNDTIKAAGYALIGIDGGAGDDVMTLQGTRIFASGGAGNDTVTIKRMDAGSGNAIAEYSFGRGDGQDKVSVNGALSLRLDGYDERDVSVAVNGNTLTATFNGSQDRISVTVDDAALKGGTVSYRFEMDQGRMVLKIA